MDQQGGAVTVVADPSTLLGRVASLLASGASLADALDELTTALGLRTALLRTTSGELLAVGGEALLAVPLMREVPVLAPTLELPVHGRDVTAALTVIGARPSQLPVLRAVAAVLGLALAPAVSAPDLLDAAEDDRDEAADALHDGAVQSLVVARYACDAAVRGGDPVLARDAVQEALVELRRALWSLRPRGGTGLAPALTQLGTWLQEAGAPRLTVLGIADATGPTATVVYRLVQSLVGTTEVRVALRSDGGVLRVDVEGPALASPERWALRVRALDGDLTSSAGRLRLTFPPAPPLDARTTP